MTKFPTEVIVTDRVIDLSTLTDAQKKYFVDLKDTVVALYQKSGKARAILSFSGESGIGKSVTVEILRKLFSCDTSNDFTVYKCGLDAFHYTNEYLIARGLKQVKGRFDTYDVSLLQKTLATFLHGEEVAFPLYSRRVHNPVQNSFVVKEKRVLLLIEGLWFLRDEDIWTHVREQCIGNFLITGSHNRGKENTIARHVLGGRTEKDAEAFYASSDHQNTLEIVQGSVPADIEIQYFGDV